MAKSICSDFAVDNASILFLSLIKPHHTNSFRFTMTLREPVCPDCLQKAVDRITPRFPTVIAKLREGFFHVRQVPVSAPPRVQPDTAILKPMTLEELRNGCFRVLYRDNAVSIEAFHALTDGSGAITTFTTLIAEYLQIRHGHVTPTGQTRLDVTQSPQPEEVHDAFLSQDSSAPRKLPSRFSYLLPRPVQADWQVRTSHYSMDMQVLLAAAHRYQVTLNTLLTSVLAATVMEYQLRNEKKGKLKPVRIMIPVDLRRLVGSRTLRNFTLYALPTMEPEQRDLPFSDLCIQIGNQLRQQLSKEQLLGMASHNVRRQNAWYVRWIPWKLKQILLRIGYRFFGESNSSLTLTNLGNVKFPEELNPYIQDFQCYLTPRVSSPYGCTVMSYNGKLSLNMSRFSHEDTLGILFFEKLKAVVEG